MNDRDFYDAMRQRGQQLAKDAVRELDAKTEDGKMFPHVAKDKVMRLRKLAKHLNALADYVEVSQ